MITIKVTKKDYDELVYPACAFATHESVGELRLCDKVLTKLEVAGSQSAPKEGDAASATPLFTMKAMTHDFQLEDHEAGYLYTKLTGQLGRIEGRRMRALLPLLEALKPKD